MKEIIDQYAPILEGKVDDADVKKKQKQIRLNGKTKSQPLHPLKKIKTSEELESENKDQSVKNKSLPQRTNDQDSTS